MSASSFFAVIRRQWPVVVAVLVVGLVAFILVLPHFRKYTATSTLLASSAPSGSTALLDPEKDATASAIGLNDLQSLAVSDAVLSRVAANLGLSRAKAASLVNEVKAKPLFASDILPIAVTDADPKLAISVANSLTAELAAYSARLATGRYDQLITNLAGQISDRKADLARIDQRIQSISSGNFYVTPEEGTSAINTRLVALQQQEEQLQAVVGGDQAAASITAQQPRISHALARHEILMQDPSVVAQREQLGKDIATLNQGLAAYTLDFPGLKSYILQVRKETRAVQNAENQTARNPGESESYVAAEIAANKAQAVLAADNAQLGAVRDEIDQLHSILSGSSGDGSEVAQLKRARAASEDVYNDLSQRLARANADRAQASSIAPVVVIDHAKEASPALLGRPPVLGAAMAVIFLWIAITLAFIVDGADDRMRTPESIEKLYGTPVFMPVG
jgi:capsular polysaccharide biosynthesis protein